MYKISALPAFNDNYIWVLQDQNQIAVIDPGDAQPVLDLIATQGLQLVAILITHHHHDHTGGAATLSKRFSAPVYGPANSPFTGIDHPLADGDQIALFGEQLHVKAVPGHTLDHICYFNTTTQPVLFCGDTLFLAGCGRLFEGSPAQMLAAMHFFKRLPDETPVYCTHEYSLANLAFAAAVEPENPAVATTTSRCQQLRSQGKATLPTTIGAEKETNPFLRTDQPSVRLAASSQSDSALHNETDIFAAIRKWKDHF